MTLNYVNEIFSKTFVICEISSTINISHNIWYVETLYYIKGEYNIIWNFVK